MPLARRLTLSATVVAFAMLLSACAPAPAVTPEPTDTPTPTETAVPAVEGPTPVFAVRCDELIDTAWLQAFIGAGVAPIALVPQAERIATIEPDAAALDQLGSLVCDWNDGQQSGSTSGPPPEVMQNAHLSLVPDAEAAAQRYVDTYAHSMPASPYGASASGPRCVGIDDRPPQELTQVGYCHLQGWLADAWIEFWVHDIDTSSFGSDADMVVAFTAFTDQVIATLGGAERAAAWTSPVSPNPVEDCESVVTTGDIAELTGVADFWVGPYWDGPRVGQYSWAADTEHALRCTFNLKAAEAHFGAVHVLPEGEWGFASASPTWLADGAVPTEVDGVPSGDAVMRCADPADVCQLDMRVAEHWLRVVVIPTTAGGTHGIPAGEGLGFEAARAAVVAIADRIVANITTG